MDYPDDPEQSILDNPPIPGPNRDLAREIRRLMRWGEPAPHAFTTRMVNRKTGLSPTTVSSLANGDRTTIGTLASFARGMEGADLNKLLKLAGFPPLGEGESLVHIPKIEREPVFDDLEEAGFGELSEQDRRKIIDYTRQLANQREETGDPLE